MVEAGGKPLRQNCLEGDSTERVEFILLVQSRSKCSRRIASAPLEELSCVVLGQSMKNTAEIVGSNPTTISHRAWIDPASASARWFLFPIENPEGHLAWANSFTAPAHASTGSA